MPRMISATATGHVLAVLHLTQIAFLVPIFWITITFDRFLAARGMMNPFMSAIPRNAVDIESRPRAFFAFLCKPQGSLPSGAQLVNLEREGGVAGEPGKNKSVSTATGNELRVQEATPAYLNQISHYKLTYVPEPGGVERTLHIFVKYQSERAASSLASVEHLVVGHELAPFRLCSGSVACVGERVAARAPRSGLEQPSCKTRLDQVAHSRTC